jgi:hypothetical protein
MITSGLLTRFQVESGRASEFEASLASALPLVARERSTFLWFAMRFQPSEYAIIDLFPNEQARARHLAGPVGQFVLGEGGPSLAEPPRVERFDVLGHCIEEDVPGDAVTKAVLLTFTVREWRETETETLLRQYGGHAEQQQQVIAWLGMAFGERRYGMFAAFRNEASYSGYLAHGAPHELAKHTPALEGATDVCMMDVVAAKLSAA